MPAEETAANSYDTLEADTAEICLLLDLLSEADALAFERTWRFALEQIENANESNLIDNEIPEMLAELRDIVAVADGTA